METVIKFGPLTLVTTYIQDVEVGFQILKFKHPQLT
jgi:hypothetical protein